GGWCEAGRIPARLRRPSDQRRRRTVGRPGAGGRSPSGRGRDRRRRRAWVRDARPPAPGAGAEAAARAPRRHTRARRGAACDGQARARRGGRPDRRGLAARRHVLLDTGVLRRARQHLLCRGRRPDGAETAGRRGDRNRAGAGRRARVLAARARGRQDPRRAPPVPAREVGFARMKIGVAREIKADEYRVALTPAGARELVQGGHDVLVEAGAGEGSSFADDAYQAVGARIVSVDEVWEGSELLLKVKEPIEPEYRRLREGLVLFTYLHIAADGP